MLCGSGLHRLERASMWIFAMNLRDARLEKNIEIASLEFHCAQTPEERRIAWERMRSLISQRSPERVRELEERKKAE